MIFSLYLIFLSIGFLYFFFHVEGKTSLKFFAVILFLHGYLTVYSTVDELSGYPSREVMPEMVQVVWGIAAEPNSTIGFEGYIDLWVTHNPTIEESWLPWFSLANEGEVSRIYRIPYTKKDHEELKVMINKIKRGKRVGLALDKKAGSLLDLSEAQQKYGIMYESIKIKK
tara:strand:+ start:1350 stop:1859 length:510 start_codon:yes stop_codon:yes gene_type:complete